MWAYYGELDLRVTLEEWAELKNDPRWAEFRRLYGYRPHGMGYVEFPGDHAVFITTTACSPWSL